MDYLIQLVISGLAVGALYSLIALGFVIIYKASDILNFAHGEITMLSAYIFYTSNALVKLPFFISFAVTLVFSFLLGLMVERVLLRRMIGEPVFAIIMVTMGLAIMMRSAIKMSWGAFNLTIPRYFPEDPIFLGEIVLPWPFLVMIVAAVGFFFLFFLFFRFSRKGLAMRATANRQDIAYIMGIDVKGIFALSWGIACLVSSVGGVLYAYINLVNPQLYYVGFKVFPAVILGGLDSITGAIVGGCIIGILENLTGGYLSHALGGGLKEVAPYAVLLLVLMIRPYGLFGTKEIERL
jgi:branched-chain amino acid transport system permease protein